MTPAYRRDIDGLRAVAVLLVVVFHAFPAVLPGGFIGVDIFFVISGFLISSIILAGLRSGDFSYRNFYARRINRIFPALMLVLGTALIAGWVLLFPLDYRDAGRAIAAGAAFVANLALLQDAGYFEGAAALNPLLHLWSLGVEEQFYLMWPPVLVLAWRRPRGAVIAALAILLASFAVNVLITPTAPLTAFYLPVTRFWELMTGCLLAIATLPSTSAEYRMLRNIGAALGLLLLIAGAVLIHSGRGFPGWWALLPVAGAALLIVAGPASWLNARLLGHPALVHIGLISYPLYLWHWPVLAALRIVRFGEEPPPLMKAIAVVGAFVLADLTWRFIERGFRYRPTRAKTAALASAVAAIGLAGIGIYAAGGVPSRFGPGVEIVTHDYKSEAEAAYRSGSCFLTVGTQFAASCDDAQPADAPRVVLWGDSHAAHLYPGLRELQLARGTFRLSQYTAALCPPIFGFQAKRARDCAALNQAVRQQLIALKPDTVILAAQQWHDYDEVDRDPAAVDQLIRATLADLKSFGVRRIVVIGRAPAWRMTPPRILAQALRTQAAGLGAASLPTRDSAHLWSSYADENERLRGFFTSAGAGFISPTQTLCDQNGCQLTVPGRGDPIAFDGSHLTVGGSRYYVEAVADRLLRQ